jgi:heme/copper-type cytochrome/quinol oxidase subunit 4
MALSMIALVLYTIAVAMVWSNAQPFTRRALLAIFVLAVVAVVAFVTLAFSMHVGAEESRRPGFRVASTFPREGVYFFT